MQAPKIAIVASSVGVFSPQGKETAEKQMRDLFEILRSKGQISQDSIFYDKRISALHEATAALDGFVKASIDGLIVLNSAFPNGNAFLKFAANQYLWRIPLVITAPPETELGNAEWTTNAYCGLIMNNYVAKRIGRQMFVLGGWPKDEKYCQEFGRLLKIIYTIRQLRQEIIGKIGDAPGGFHCCAADPLAYAKTFGIQIETLDVSALIETCRSGKAAGSVTECSFGQAEVDTVLERMLKGKKVHADLESIRNAANLYCAIKAQVQANGFTSISLRCWPEIMQQLHVSACLVLGQLMSDGVVTAAACEGDWPTAVAQCIAGYLSSNPAACLDFVNQIDASSILQAGHCGVGIASLMQDAAIGHISPDRQAGIKIGPTCIGQFRHGPKTGVSLIKTETDKFKMLVFTGESSPNTQKNILYCAADIQVAKPQKLNECILQHGFPHHLAVAFGHINYELKLFCEFYGIEYINPDD